MSKNFRLRKPVRSRTQAYGLRRRRANTSRTKAFIWLLILMGGFFLFRGLLSSDESVSAEATINIRQGVLEFSLDGEALWTRATSGQTFLPGDRIRCTGNCEADVEVLDGGTILVLGPNSELSFETLQQTESGKKNVTLHLETGVAWATVTDNQFVQKGSSFLLITPHGEIKTEGGIFNVTSTEKEDLIQVLRGTLELQAIAEKKSIGKPLSVSVGQQLLVDDLFRSFVEKEEGDKALAPLVSTFEESEWNLQNLERFRPQEAAEIRHRIEKNSTPQEQDPSKNGLDSPTITSPAPGTVIPASQDTLELEGTAPPDAYRISVNGYVLTKFQPGDRKWSYFASKKFGTLVPGENSFEVVSVSRDGRESAPASVQITYEGSNAPVVITESESDFPVPIVRVPEITDASQVFKTSDPVLHITGIVDPRTIAVEVNGFRLQKYQAGDTEWKYIANASYENMVEGENVYTVVAFGPNNEQSSTSLRVHYTPQ